MKRVSFVLAASIAVVMAVGAGAASAQTFCVQMSSRNLYLPSPGTTCQKGETVVNMATSADVSALTARVTALETANAELQSRLAGVSRNGNTLRFSGMNLQLVDGLGSTGFTNGLGNLLIGYNENPGDQTGSHNLLLGTDQSFTSWGGIVAGSHNKISGAFASVTGGVNNEASGPWSTVTGGGYNTANGFYSSISGGSENTSDIYGSVSGGEHNSALGEGSSILGGNGTTLTTPDSTYPAGP